MTSSDFNEIEDVMARDEVEDNPPPDEVWLSIMGHMEPLDIRSLASTNLRLLRVGRDQLLWRNIIIKVLTQYGIETKP